MLELVQAGDRETRHILFDEKFEELSIPKYFLKENLDILSHVNTFQRQQNIQSMTLNYSQKFALNSDYIFFAQSVLQQKKLTLRTRSFA